MRKPLFRKTFNKPAEKHGFLSLFFVFFFVLLPALLYFLFFYPVTPSFVLRFEWIWALVFVAAVFFLTFVFILYFKVPKNFFAITLPLCLAIITIFLTVDWNGWLRVLLVIGVVFFSGFIVRFIADKVK